MTEDSVYAPSVLQIQRAVAQHFHISVMEMTSDRRGRDVARPRQIAMYLARFLTPLSYPQIGREFGGRDHTTVMHAVAIVKKRADEPQIAEAIKTLADTLRHPDQFPLPLSYRVLKSETKR